MTPETIKKANELTAQIARLDTMRERLAGQASSQQGYEHSKHQCIKDALDSWHGGQDVPEGDWAKVHQAYENAVLRNLAARKKELADL